VTLEQDYDATLVEIEIVKNSTVVDVLPDGSIVIRPVT
jgi:hypothetical protein